MNIGHTYNIYQRSDEDEACIDAYINVQSWLHFLKLYYFSGNDLPSSQFIFPSVNTATYNINMDLEMSSNSVNEMVKMFAKDAGLIQGDNSDITTFTTHCFRRGGAQHAFMYAPVGERWTLALCRWWGGWAPGESVSFLDINCCFVVPDPLYQSNY